MSSAPKRFFKFNQLAQWRAIAIHREDRFGDDENALARMFAPSPFEMTLEFAQMIVRKYPQDGAAESCPIDE